MLADRDIHEEANMSRTYRKRSYTEDETRVQYINRNIAALPRWRVKFVITDYNRQRYEADHAEYRRALRDYYKDWQPAYKRPEEPRLFSYKDRVVVKIEYDYDTEVERFGKEYDRFRRDGHWNETGRNRAFKKHCAKDLRHKNKEVINKILKGEDDWDQKPFPDTYMGKQYVWDYW